MLLLVTGVNTCSGGAAAVVGCRSGKLAPAVGVFPLLQLRPSSCRQSFPRNIRVGADFARRAGSALVRPAASPSISSFSCGDCPLTTSDGTVGKRPCSSAPSAACGSQGINGGSSGGGASGGDADPFADVLSDPDVAFGNLSKRIHRGFKFDRMFESNEMSPSDALELDRLAMTSMKTQSVPRPLMVKILRLLRDFGQKKDIEKYGRYMNKKSRSRASAEIPRVLSSLFLPEHDDPDTGPISKLKKNPAFRDLFEHAGSSSLDDASIKRLALANMEDRKHKLYQMFWSPEGALTYLAHRYPAVWAANFRVLYELARRAPDFKPRRILDYGAGPAPSVAVAHDIWGDFELVVAVEPSENMTQVGQYMLTDLDLPPVRWRRCLYDEGEKHDLIIASFVQMEVRGQESRDALVKQLWNRLDYGGVLVLIEPGTPTGFRFMHHTRELLISRIGPDNFHFVAPCPHEGMCPLAVTGRDWCHFVQRVKRTNPKLYNKGQRATDFEETRFSFLCIRKSPGPRSKYFSEKEAPTPVEKSYFWPRVLFPPLKAGKHALVDVCSAPQNFERLVASKSKAHSFGYRWTRKAMWGDLFRYPKRIARPEARLYIPEEARMHLDRLAKKAWRALKWNDPGFKEEEARDEQFYGR